MTREAFMEFYAKIQDVHNDIDFDEVAIEEPGKPLVALDVTLAIEQGSIVWRHYRKDTASDQVIHYRSAHDEGTKRNYISSEVCRILRNCKHQDDATPHLEDFRRRLLLGEWPGIVIEHLFRKGYARRDGIRRQIAGPLARSEYRTREEREELRSVAERIKKAARISSGVPEPTLIAIPWCKDKTLFNQIQYLVKRYKLPYRVYERVGLRAAYIHSTVDLYPNKCSECVLCESQIDPDFPRPPCDLKNFVYILTCKICNKQYVGETKRTALTRFREHLDVSAAERWLQKHSGDVSAAGPNNEDSDSEDEKGPGPSMYAIHACKDHGGMNLAAHTSIGVIMKARNCAHRKSIESSYLQVHVPRGKCELNIQLGNNGAANMQ